MNIRARLEKSIGDTFVIERELGGGGMSTVFVAEEKALGRNVVIKVLPPDLAAEISTERFTREIRLAARLQQANIIPLLHAGVADGIPYYTMPFVDGLSLRARIRQDGPMPLGAAISVLRDVAKALAYAHANGVVHRDIKPENVLISGGTAIVTDFGIAKAISASMATAPDGTLTQAGITMGTPAYMSPEQAAGDPIIDHRSDLYAWGVLAYELLSGSHPFRDCKTTSQLLTAHLTRDPEPLETAAPDVPTAVAETVMWCLEKDAAARPADASELVGAFEATGARTAPSGTGRRLAPANSVAVLPFTNLSPDPENEYFADGITEEILNGLAHVRGLQVVARTSSFQFKGKNIALRTIGDQLKVRTVLEGSVRRAGDRVRITVQLVNVRDGFHLWSAKFDRELADVFAVQDELAAAIVTQLRARLGTAVAQLETPMPPALRRAANADAYAWFFKGRVFQDQRVEGMQQARDCFERAVAIDPTFGPAHAHLGRVALYESLYTFRAPLDGFSDARARARTALAFDAQSVEAHIVLAYVALFHDWDIPTAIRHLDCADEAGPPTTASLSGRAWTEFTQGHVAPAIALCEDAVRLDPLALEPRINLCMMLYFSGQFERAIREAEGSLERSVVQSEPLRFKGLSLLSLGRIDEALDVLQQCVAISQRGGWALASLTTALSKAGRNDDVTAITSELRKRGEAGWVPALLLSVAAYYAGDPAEGAAQLQRSMEERDFWLPCLHLDHVFVEVFRQDPVAVAMFKAARIPFPA